MIDAVHLVWITAGLGCDGDTIAMTAASLPSLAELVAGALPGVPRVILHNPVLAYENGDAFMQSMRDAAAGKLDPFILVIEGSIPNEKNKAEGFWAALGVDAATGQPILTCEWIDRLAPRAHAVIAAGTCATYGGIHAMLGNPTGCMGLPDYLGWSFRSAGGVPIVCVPGCPVQPDNFTETLSYLLQQLAGSAPMIPLDEALRPRWLFTQTVHEGCDRGGYYEQAVGTVPSVQLFSEYFVRLSRYVDFVKRMVPLHDDLFDFFLEALPGYERVGQRRVLLGCWGAFQDPDACDFRYQTMSQWGREMFVTPGIVMDGELITTDLVEINLGIRILLGSSFYDDWEGQETFVRRDPLGNPIDQRHPWNQTTLPRPQKRDLQGRYTWVMSPRWLDRRSGAHLALDSGGGPLARLWVTALAGKVDFPGVKATGSSVKIRLPRTAQLPETELEWKIPRWSNTLERDRARSYFQAYAAAAALHFIDRGRKLVHGGDTRTWNDFKVPDEAIGCGFHEAVRGLLSHHMVIRKGRIANYHPYPPTPWNASPRDSFGTPGPYEDAIQGSPLFEENGPESFKGIDIMRTVRSFDPCLPCGVHMMLGDGKVLEVRHSPTFGAQIGGPP